MESAKGAYNENSLAERRCDHGKVKKNSGQPLGMAYWTGCFVAFFIIDGKGD